MTSTLTAVNCNFQDLVLQNIVTINQNALVKNFMLINKCMSNFKVFTEKFAAVDKTNKMLTQQVQRIKKKQDKDYLQLKGFINEAKEYSSEHSTKMTSKMKLQQQKARFQANRLLEEEIRKNLRVELQTLIKNSMQKELEVFRETDSTRIKQIKIMQVELDKLRKQILLLKNNKLDTEQYLAFKNYFFQSQKKVEELKVSVQEVAKEKIDFQQVDYTPQFNKIKCDFNTQIEEIYKKLKFKADYSDALKLEELLVNMIVHTSGILNKKHADKAETKKALIFLEKRINKVLLTIFGDEDNADALIGTKGWKCISCTKDLKQYEGRLDKFKPWAIFPAKQLSKQKYSGFGVGFQTVVEKAVEKKGIQLNYDQYGRMTTPFNLSREVNIGSNKQQTPSTMAKDRGLSASQSNTKIKNQVPNQGLNKSTAYIETNFMTHYGNTNADPNFNIQQEYKSKFSGLQEHIKFIIDRKKESSK